MSYYVTSQCETPNFQVIETSTSSLWSCHSSLPPLLLELSSQPTAITASVHCSSIESRLDFIMKRGTNRTFTYYGPFESIDELTSYFTNNHPELLI